MQADSSTTASSDRPTLAVIITSTRPGRVGLPVGEWFIEQAEADGTFDVQKVDLAELDLPFMDEPNHPRMRQSPRITRRRGARSSIPPTPSCS